MSWVAIVDKHIQTNDFDKCVVMEDIDYKDDIPDQPQDPNEEIKEFETNYELLKELSNC